MPEYILAIKDRKPGEPDPAVLDGNIVGEIVRCNDCKYVCKRMATEMFPDMPVYAMCTLTEEVHDPDWFCADGERKTDY